jgi:hypothetical protein
MKTLASMKGVVLMWALAATAWNFSACSGCAEEEPFDGWLDGWDAEGTDGLELDGEDQTLPDADVPPDVPPDGTEDIYVERICRPGDSECLDFETLSVCNEDGTGYVTEPCGEGRVCQEGVCIIQLCVPGQRYCVDDTTWQVCNDEGTGYDPGGTCDPEEPCIDGDCYSPCMLAEAMRSSVGCDYWAVAAANSQLSGDFEYAVAIANPQDEDAVVDITNGGGVSTTLTVPAHSLQAAVLPYFPDLKTEFRAEWSALDPNGVYSIHSSVPVAAYQFNPQEYMLTHDCSDPTQDPDPTDGRCYSYSNDASLLLPEHVLTGNYYVMSRPTMTIQRMGTLTHSPGFVAIAAVKPGTTNVDITFSCRTYASEDGSIRSYTRGETGSFSLAQYGVLQILSDMPSSCLNGVSEAGYTYCNNGYEYDLSGTRITADQAVAVFSGHNCTFVPFNRWACDHLEEQMFPLETWGMEYVVSRSIPMFTSDPEPNMWKLLSGADGNVISFDPPGVNPTITLNAGQWVEFEAWDDFQVTGTEGFIVTQFMVGMNYYGSMAPASENGDPAMCLGVPFEQYRDAYTFLTPLTFERSYVNVTITSGFEDSVLLDGAAVSASWSPVGSSGFVTATVELAGGVHTMSADDVFGIIVYGVGDYTSYMYPGGLNLELINPV